MSEESIRVWIAESDDAQRRALRELVQRDPRFDVIGESASGKETLDAMGQLHPDILLLALALREYDGLHVLEMLSKSALIHYPRVAVITAMAGTQTERVIALGADVCFSKPVDEDRLLAWLARVREQPALVQAGFAFRRQMAIHVLEYLGMSSSLNGYSYLTEAVTLASADHTLTRHMMTDLYPRVARMYDTTVPCVERAIRHAIEETWTSGKMSAADSLFGYTVDPQRGKPTNTECIARLSEYVRFLMVGGGDILHVIPGELLPADV